jgi:hypothetical protein
MNKIKQYFKYVNQWSVIFWFLIISQLVLGWEHDHYDWNNVWGAFVIWALYLLGYNSLDRELEIKLELAKEAIAKNDKQD